MIVRTCSCTCCPLVYLLWKMIAERCYLSMDLIFISLMMSEDEGTGFWNRKKRHESPCDDKDLECISNYFLCYAPKYPHTKLSTQFPLSWVKVLSSTAIILKKIIHQMAWVHTRETGVWKHISLIQAPQLASLHYTTLNQEQSSGTSKEEQKSATGKFNVRQIPKSG